MQYIHIIQHDQFIQENKEYTFKNTLRTSDCFIINKVNQSHYILEVSRGFQEVRVPRLHDNGPGW
jgi:hypothetical protein